jgi:hypothetical protein
MTYRQATFNGKPTYEFQDQAKSDLDICLSCCEAELECFYENNNALAPAPYFFEKASAILAKKRDWRGVIDIAERYIDAIEKYRATATPASAKVWLSPKVDKIKARLVKALLAVQ